MAELRQRVEKLASRRIPVVILGESGTGKELVAGAIVQLGGWKPFVRVNCAALPESIVDAELFGYERGAFTGAVRSHRGLVEEANGGVLFLDELAELPLAVQAKLLRALDPGEYRPLGSARTLRSTFRLIAATNGDIDKLVAEKRMRTDFLHRLGGLPVRLPPLRERLEDIPLLANHFLSGYRQRDPEAPAGITPGALALLHEHSWPGNVRELRNVIEASAVLAARAGRIGAEHVLEALAAWSQEREPLTELPTLAEAVRRTEQEVIRSALRLERGNHERAARRIGISPATLYRKLAASTGTTSPALSIESGSGAQTLNLESLRAAESPAQASPTRERSRRCMRDGTDGALLP